MAWQTAILDCAWYFETILEIELEIIMCEEIKDQF